MNQFRGRLLPAIVLVLAGVLGGASFVANRIALAQQFGAPVITASSTIAISGSTPAVIVTAVAGRSIVVTSMKIASITTGGIVTFYNGTASAAFGDGNGLNVYAPASTSVNNNVDVTAALIGPTGKATTAGNGLYAQLNGCTLCYTVQYYLQ